ncbi:MAG: phage baseplate assembly protein V [Candidatus Cloacimonetes bacterium]|nr:phage baseplate assembly protein V [Candidatus Cloacimonadota bacterium]
MNFDMRVGKVVNTDTANCTARVQFSDIDDLISADLPILQRNTQNNKDYNMVDVDEQVLCVLFENSGVILGSVYNQQDTPHFDSQDVRGVKFDDDTEVSYDRKGHSLKAIVEGHIEAVITKFIKAEIKENVELCVKETIKLLVSECVKMTINDQLEAIVGNLFEIKSPSIRIIDNQSIEIDNQNFELNNTNTDIKSATTNIAGNVNLGNNACQPVVHAMTLCPLFGTPIGSAGPKASTVKVPLD